MTKKDAISWALTWIILIIGMIGLGFLITSDNFTVSTFGLLRSTISITIITLIVITLIIIYRKLATKE